MKKIFLSVGILAMLSMVACDNKNKESDTTGAVPAKVVNTIDETDIIISEDTTGSTVQNMNEELDKAGENLKQAAKDGKQAVTDKAEEVKEKAADKAGEITDKAKSKLKSGANAVAEKANEISEQL